MNIKYSLLGICSLLILLNSSCQKELPQSDQVQGNARLKRILLIASKDSSEPISIVEEYEYDENGRITRTSSPMYEDGVIVGTIRYDLYEYNSSGQLIKIKNYNANLNSPSGYINLENRTFIYNDDGNKKKETIEYPEAGIIEYFMYEYLKGQLIKIKKYNNKSELQSYVENRYDKSGKLVKESSFAPDDHCFSYTIHTYSGPLLLKSDVFRGGVHLREIIRTYDENNNLIILESNELAPFSSASSYVLKYEYYEEV
jgi:hypothetical protein